MTALYIEWCKECTSQYKRTHPICFELMVHIGKYFKTAHTLFSDVSGFSHFGRWCAASINKNSPSLSDTLHEERVRWVACLSISLPISPVSYKFRPSAILPRAHVQVISLVPAILGVIFHSEWWTKHFIDSEKLPSSSCILSGLTIKLFMECNVIPWKHSLLRLSVNTVLGTSIYQGEKEYLGFKNPQRPVA